MKRSYKKGLAVVMIAMLLAGGLVACHASYNGSINPKGESHLIQLS